MILSIIEMSLMAIEILIAEYVFTLMLERKNYGFFRLIASLIICIEFTIIIVLLYYFSTNSAFEYNRAASIESSLFKLFFYLIIFALTIFCTYASCKASLWSVLTCCSGGYATQHLSKNVANYFSLLPSFQNAWASFIIEPLICGIALILAYFLLIKNNQPSESNRNIKLKALLSLTVIIICIGLSRLTTDDGARGTLAFIAESAYAIISCGLVLVILFSITENDKMTTEVAIMTELLYRAKEQYRISKENVELINIKCHDMKHQIRKIGENKQIAREVIDEIEKSISLYDSIVKTENEVLDTILTEKSLVCNADHIALSCVADGKCISFMNPYDVYSLFGNALDNAIEAVHKVSDKEKRVIGVVLFEKWNMITININNSFEGKNQYENGIPLTTKDDKANHGYGVKSISMIAEKYGGTISCSEDKFVFSLSVLLPVPNKQ